MKAFVKLITLVVLFSLVVSCGGTPATTVATEPPATQPPATQPPPPKYLSRRRSNGPRTMASAHTSPPRKTGRLLKRRQSWKGQCVCIPTLPKLRK